MIKNHFHCLCPHFSVWWESSSASIPPQTSLGEPAKGFKPNLSLGVSYSSNLSKNCLCSWATLEIHKRLRSWGKKSPKFCTTAIKKYFFVKDNNQFQQVGCGPLFAPIHTNFPKTNKFNSHIQLALGLGKLR